MRVTAVSYAGGRQTETQTLSGSVIRSVLTGYMLGCFPLKQPFLIMHMNYPPPPSVYSCLSVVNIMQICQANVMLPTG